MRDTRRWSVGRLGMGLGGIAAALSGCVTAPVVIPAGGAPQAQASAGGVMLTVLAAQWEGEPSDLGEYVTPVYVVIDNQGSSEARVSYIDFSLNDESGFRYAALNPFVPAALGLRESEMAPGVLVAGRGFGVRIGPPPAAHFTPRMTVHGGFGTPPGPRFRAGYVGGGHFQGGGRHFTGYLPYPSYRPFFGVGFSSGYWGDPLLYPAGYATWVWPWSPSYYPAPRPPSEVVEAALPEGVLQAGGHVEGFLYFQRSHDNARTLTLSYDAHEARSGTPFGQARVLLEIRR